MKYTQFFNDNHRTVRKQTHKPLDHYQVPNYTSLDVKSIDSQSPGRSQMSYDGFSPNRSITASPQGFRTLPVNVRYTP